MKNKIIKYNSFKTEIGDIFIASTDNGICRLSIGSNENDFIKDLNNRHNYEIIKDDDFLMNIIKNIKDYFSKKNKNIDYKIDFLEGTGFQRKVWNKLLEIEYGQTRSYKWIANQIGHKDAYRAVGNANSKNPIPLLVPCHRVTKEDGTLGGFSSGVWRKEFLLKLEEAIE